MSTFKDYAKQARNRLKNGFWENAKKQLQQEKQVAATMGLNVKQVGEENKRKLQMQIYNDGAYEQEQEFYQRVVAILTSSQVVSNPIMLLADKDYMQTLSAEQQQVYIAKLAAKYRQAVEKYNKLRS